MFVLIVASDSIKGRFCYTCNLAKSELTKYQTRTRLLILRMVNTIYVAGFTK